ncbi:MAG: beta strand repeat-containing protein [Gammaproteobacteria bacterium]
MQFPPCSRREEGGIQGGFFFPVEEESPRACAGKGGENRGVAGAKAPYLGLIAAVALSLFAVSAARAAPTGVTGAAASVTITGPSPATLAFPFTRAGGDSTYDVWINYKTVDGTAQAGTDYTGAHGAFRLPAGAATATLPLTALGASNVSPDKFFTLDFLGAVGVGPTPAFAEQTTFPVGNTPASVAMADVNGDGKPDLITANVSYSVSVRLNTTTPGAAAPSFDAAVNFTAGSDPTSVAVADVNGDGRPDLIVANTVTPGSVTVLLNTTAPGATTPSFSGAASFPVGKAPRSVVVADVNGDGKLDLITANEVGDNVSVLLNTTAPGASIPSFATQQTFAVGSYPVSVTAADMNGDGKPDLIVANNNDNNVSVLLNTTAPGASIPSFAAQQTFAAGSYPVSVAAADVNGDGRPDLIVANADDNTVAVLLNTTSPGATTASFTTATTFATGLAPDAVTASDVNGDGKPELIVANQNSHTVTVLLNTTVPGAATPSFATHQDFAAGTSPHSVAASDINGDGKPDLIAVNVNDSTASVLMNTTPAPTATAPSFAGPAAFDAGDSPFAVAAADMNGDGKPDFAVADNCCDDVTIFLNDTLPGAAQADFIAAAAFSVGASPLAVAAADLNGDGKPDLAVTNSGETSVSVLMNQTAPGSDTPDFADPTDFTVGVAPFSVAAADVNGDGKPDLIATSAGGDSVSFLLNTTPPGAMTPSFAGVQTVALTAGSNPRTVVAADVNGDGRSDFAVADYGTGVSNGALSVLLNTTAPGAMTVSMAVPADSPTGHDTYSLATADVNGDGRPDLIAANADADNVSVLLNQTAPGAMTASFAVHVDFAAGGNSYSIAVADVNGDGRPDLVATDGTPGVSVFLNATPPGAIVPQFPDVTTYSFGTEPIAITTADANGDGQPDLLVADDLAGTVSVLLNSRLGVSLAPAAVIGTIAYVMPVIASLPAALDFGTQRVGGAGASQSLTLRNSGNADLNYTLTLSGAAKDDYTQSNDCPSPLTAGSQCTVTIGFKPAAAGTRAAALTVTSNAPSSPDVVALTGVGNLVPPVAYDLALATYENKTIGGTLPASGPTGDPLSYVITAGPDHGVTVVTVATGAFTYKPDTDFHGPDSFMFTATDTMTGQVSNTATVTITVNATPPPDQVPPVASNLALTTYENQAITGTLPAVVTPATDALSFAATQPTHGTVAVTDPATGAFTYTPASGYSGSDSFMFTATDTVTGLVSNTATVNVTIAATPPPADVAPVASNLALTTYENQALTGTLPAAVTPATDALSFAATQPTHGTVAITNTATGAFTYTPASNYSGSDSFMFTATDTVTGLVSNTATVNITINTTPPPSDVAPVASNLDLTTYENQTITGTLPAVVTPSADTLVFVITAFSTHGTAVVTDPATGAFTYMPASGYSGSDSFSFTAKDTVTGLTSNTAMVAITVNATPPPDSVPPVASNLDLSAYENEALTGSLPAVVTPSADALSFTATQPTHGTVAITNTATGAFTYTPASGYSGSDNFTFIATDTVTGLVSNTATVNITINATPPPNPVAPVASNLALTSYENQALAGTLPAVVTPATDALSFAASTAAHGTVDVTDAASGAFTYTPNAGYSGADSFSFMATDTVTGLVSNTATVAITINATPPPAAVPPVASDLALTTYENIALTGTLPAVVTPSANTLSFAATQPTHGTVAITDTATGAFTYTPASDYHGTDAFTFTATDSVTGLVSNTATATMVVNPTPPPGEVPPVAANLTLTTYMNAALSGTLPAAVTPAGDPLEFQIVVPPKHGTLKLTDAATGAFSYKPADGHIGSDSFSFTATDTTTGLTSNVAMVKIYVYTPPKPPPADSGGGGFGWPALAVLLGLAGLALGLRWRRG